MKRIEWALSLFLGVAISFAQSPNPVPGDPVTVSGKVGIGTISPSSKVEIQTSTVWDGLKIVGTQPDGAGAYFGMRSTGGTNRSGLHIYADSRPEQDALKFQTDYRYIQFWTLLGNPYSLMTLTHTGDAHIAGDVYSRGVKLGPAGSVIQVPVKGDKGDRGENGRDGERVVAAALSITSIVKNYTRSTDLECSPGYVVLTASCDLSGGAVITDRLSLLPPGSTGWAHYLTPNVNNATGVHCDLGGGVSAQARVRCGRIR